MQIINYPEDIKQGLQKNSWVLELLGKETNRRYLFHKLLNYLSQSDNEIQLKLLGDILTTEPRNSSHVHPLSLIFTLEFKPVKQSTQSLFSATESELEQLQKMYQSLSRENVYLSK